MSLPMQGRKISLMGSCLLTPSCPGLYLISVLKYYLNPKLFFNICLQNQAASETYNIPIGNRECLQFLTRCLENDSYYSLKIIKLVLSVFSTKLFPLYF